MNPFDVLRRFLGKTKQRVLSIASGRSSRTHASYSQAGEDRIVAFLFQMIGINDPSYLDVGANKPELFSNTCLFYKRGSSGVCIEANPLLWEQFRKARPRDITLNVGVGAAARDSLPFHRFGPEADGMSTFSADNAEATESTTPYRVREILNIPVVTINSILEEFFPEPPDFLSIDVEGLDREILESLDFGKHAPLVICAETHSQENGEFIKDRDFINFVVNRGYTVFADTYLNTIFLRNDRCGPFAG